MSYWIYVKHSRRPGEKGRPKEMLPTGYPSMMEAMDAAWAEEQRRSAAGQTVSTLIVNGDGEPVDFRGEPVR